MWLKVGLIGLIVYLGLLFELARSAWKRIKEERSMKKEVSMSFGLFLALFALIVTNIFTPYLNHPLGIGFILLMTMMLLTQRDELAERS